MKYININQERDRIREELKVREQLTGGTWEVILEADVGCKVSETKTQNLVDTFDAVDDSIAPQKNPSYNSTGGMLCKEEN